ncbi:hypothetical protein CSB20_13730 [bacterium DOLZORAL124_64_63]|nr:MAG: hypothetical protein CSB20_13730 [bacterium DOLZORAL124_64_63]
MNGKLKKGLGIGCALLVIAVFLVIGSVAFVLQRVSGDYRQARDSQEALFAEQGDPWQYTPGNGGLPTAERVAVFLTVRRELGEWRASTATMLADFLHLKQKKEEQGGLLTTYRLAREGGDLASHLARYWTARNRALMRHGMGLGEYAYLYALAYYAYLGYDPADGVRRLGLELGGEAGGLTLRADASAEGERQDRAWARVHHLITPMLRRAAESGSAADPAAEPAADLAVAPAWHQALTQELDLLAESPLRYPWRDGAPQPLADAFRAHRQELEQLYGVAVNPVEWLFEQPAAED